MNNTFTYYDIESLSNAFTLCLYHEKTDTAHVFYIWDDKHNHIQNETTFDKKLKQTIYKRNPVFKGQIILYNLNDNNQTLCIENNHRLASIFGLSDAQNINDPTSVNSYNNDPVNPNPYTRLVCDTDPEYDPSKHPFLVGYNSKSYDLTILSLYLYETFNLQLINNTHIRTIKPPTAKIMRQYNNAMFNSFKENMPDILKHNYNTQLKTFQYQGYNTTQNKIYTNMLRTGRHVDASRLNELMFKVALKRLLALLGYQILESKQLKQGQDTIENAEQFYELVAYNFSDTIYLAKLMQHDFYQARFTLKQELLKTYPELIYQKQQNTYAPNISQKTVRYDRLTIDSTSAQFASKVLCPYDELQDRETVSFLYPSEKKAKELGIKQINVLEYVKEWFYNKFPQQHCRDEFDRIYNYYKSIQGKNFNHSDKYYSYYAKQTEQPLPPYHLKDIPKPDLNLFYFNADGTPSSCFVTFSTGGIHGQECNIWQYQIEYQEYLNQKELQDKAKEQYPDPVELRKAKTITIDGVEYPWKQFLSAPTIAKATYKEIKAPELIKDNNKLNSKYVFTSAGIVNHEDFKSYYPNMLRMMEAFFNEGLGYDRYGQIYDQKEEYGVLAKDKSYSAEERKVFNNKREGTKLVMNSASGAADTAYENPINMNNQIISMRIIGQLFSYLIGQSQTYYGARVPSTNTDGLYTMLEEKLNEHILNIESKNINVDIEPETIFFVSKDSNNRVEFSNNNPFTTKTIGTSGGSVACAKGPTPTKALSHPAIIDYVLVQYLKHTVMTKQDVYLLQPFDRQLAKNLFDEANKTFDTPFKYLNMYQNIIASNKASDTYVFATKPHDIKPIILQHYNRVFIMHDDTPATLNLQAAHARKITPAMKSARQTNNESPKQHDQLASLVLTANGINVSQLPSDQEAALKKITGIEPDWYILIYNHDLHLVDDETFENIKINLDIDKYIDMLESTFEANWRNHLSDEAIALLPPTTIPQGNGLFEKEHTNG